VIEDTKVPGPEPSIVFVVKVIVGEVLVLHTTPLAVTVLPPSDVTLPPEVALVVKILDTSAVVTVGAIAVVVN
jgi:hypothetical protein